MTVRRVVRAEFWRGVAAGLSVEVAAGAAGVSVSWARGAFRQVGGVIPRHLLKADSGRYLSSMDRAVIQVLLEQGLSIRAVAARLGRAPSTISREVRRNRRPSHPYSAGRAQLRTDQRRLRPRPSKLALEGPLRQEVVRELNQKWSPMQISRRLVMRFPDRQDMRVSHETIYRALYIQARGGLKREVEAALRSGRAIRRPRSSTPARGSSIPRKVMISERPAQAQDRAIPGHWEGDLIIGKDGRSQIGTLVERSTRYVLLVHLPGSRDATTVADALIRTVATLPTHLKRSLTWDQGIEMAAHERITLEADLPIYFCDPHSPWQRGSNENTNGLLRQYSPKAPTSPPTPPNTSRSSPPNSTAAPA